MFQASGSAVFVSGEEASPHLAPPHLASPHLASPHLARLSEELRIVQERKVGHVWTPVVGF